MKEASEQKSPRLNNASTLDRAAEWLTFWSEENWSIGDVLARLYEWVPHAEGKMLLQPESVRIVIPAGAMLVNRMTGEKTKLERPKTLLVGGIALDSLLQNLHEHGEAIPQTVTSEYGAMRWCMETPITPDAMRLTVSQVESLLPDFERLVLGLHRGEQELHDLEKSMTDTTSEPKRQADVSAIRKKQTLITELEHEWPTIYKDLSEATRNGLKEAAHQKHSMWDMNKARVWAESKGKIKQTVIPPVWPRTVSRHKTGD